MLKSNKVQETILLGSKRTMASKAKKTDFRPSASLPENRIFPLQQSIGNQALQRLLRSGGIQAKLSIGQPNDKYEQEADRVADQVMRMPKNSGVIGQSPEMSKKHETVQGKTPDAGNGLESDIQSLRGYGRPLPESVRSYFECRIGHDFSRVRLHTNARAKQTAHKINARAFTLGQDIVFGANQYAPSTSAGRRLLAHELVHVSQMRSNIVMRSAFDSEDPALRTRRLAAIGSARTAVQRLRRALSQGFIWPFENVTASGVYAQPIVGLGGEETVSNREARLRQLITDLIHMVIELESAPIPSPWLHSAVYYAGGAAIEASSFSLEYQDTLMFYAHRAVGRGQSGDLAWPNWFYINTDPIPTRRIAPVRSPAGQSTGIFIHLDDPINEPLVYRRVTGGEGSTFPGYDAEVFRDEFGYYYIYRRTRHYLPGRP